MRAKLLVSLVLAASASSVFAMPYDPVKHPGILEVALTGGGFKVDTNDTAYGIHASSFLDTGILASGHVLKNDPKYKFGGSVLLGYYFPCSTINVDASYTGARARRYDSATGSITPGLVPPQQSQTEVGTAADSSYHFDYDFVNLEMGSLTRVNQNGLILNPQLGLSYARLKGEQVVGYSGGTITNPYAVIQDSRFNGFGPSVGLDLNFVVCNPINLTGNIRYSALVGNVHSSTTASSTIASINDNHIESKNALVSLFQSELALGYDFNWCDMFCGNFAIGYQLTKAIDSGERMIFTSDGGGVGPDGGSNFVSNLFNKSIHGYFARLTMDFEV